MLACKDCGTEMERSRMGRPKSFCSDCAAERSRESNKRSRAKARRAKSDILAEAGWTLSLLGPDGSRILSATTLGGVEDTAARLAAAHIALRK